MKITLFLMLMMSSVLVGSADARGTSLMLERSLQTSEVECVVRALETRGRDIRGSYQKQTETFRNHVNPEGDWIDKVRFWKNGASNSTSGWTSSRLESLLEQSQSQLEAELDQHQQSYVEALKSCQVF